ncbi:MAG: hypothetical protein HQL21_00365 [Candidatus Omnitrophica bacterium]|nr:hypothetical protein [Candidatus Omnitrophota bacterium]
MTTQFLKTIFAILWALSGVLLFSVPARADIKEIKKYKEAFPETKPKCIECHVAALPKKDDGQHENNDYGKAVLAEAQKEEAKEAEPTVETYKKVGKIEEFKK